MTFWVSELGCFPMWRSAFTRSFVFRCRQTAASYRYRNIECLIKREWVSEWVVCLFFTVADVRGKWLHLCAHCTAYSEQKVTWLRRTCLRRSFLSFFLSSVWLIYDSVSSKTLRFKNRIRECLIRYSITAQSWMMGTAWLWFVENNTRDCQVIMHALSLIRLTQSRLVGFSNGMYYGTNRGTVVSGSRKISR